MSRLSSPFVKWSAGAIAFVALLGVLRFRPWQQAATRSSTAAAPAAREALAVGFLPVTCHLTCPVTDYATKTSQSTRFESQRFTDFPTVVETVKSGRLDATFMIAPLAGTWVYEHHGYRTLWYSCAPIGFVLFTGFWLCSSILKREQGALQESITE